MKNPRKSAVYRAGLLSASLAVLLSASAFGQDSGSLPGIVQNSSAQNAYLGSVQAVAATPEVKQLTLDDAIRLGLENNLALTLARENEKTADAQRLQFIDVLLPNISLHGETGVHQYNLGAEGFRLSLLPEFASVLPPGISLTSVPFPLVVKVDTTIGQINLSQPLFNWAGYDVWRAAKASQKAAYYNTQSSRGLVVLNVGTAYLQALSDSAQIDYARALLKTDEALLNQAHQEHLAGTAANLDELRARVQYETQQQTVINAENTFEKDKIALNRQIGLDPGQKIQLSDAAPYAELADIDIGQAKQEAYANRQDYQSMLQQIRAAGLERKATVHQRFPTLTFTGNYGITGVSGSIWHDTFAAQGNLSVPIFEEAKFRGDRDVAEAQLQELRTQMDDLRQKIDQQLRDSLLDLQTAAQLVSVTRSNVDLATTALEQTSDRFQAGIDDNLPVTQAQSTLSDAQTRYVNAVHQFNEAKLTLARHLGIIDTQYKAYLGSGPGSGPPPQGGK